MKRPVGVGVSDRILEEARVCPRPIAIALVIALACSLSATEKGVSAADAAAGLPRVSQGSKLEWRFELLPRSFQRHPRVDFNVITEMTDAGRLAPRPSVESPLHYALQFSETSDLGSEPDGGSRRPELEFVSQALERALAERGLLPGDPPANPATVFLACHWGQYTLLHDDPEFDSANRVRKRRELLDRAALIGGERFAIEFAEVLEKSDRYTEAMAAFVNTNSGFPPILGDMTPGTDFMNPLEMFMRRDLKTRHLVEESIRPCYFVIVSAYDFQSAIRNRRVLLWRTKMTVSAEGLSMQETLVPLIANTGAYLGTEMLETATIEKRIDRKGKVEMGPLRVVGYEQPESGVVSESAHESKDPGLSKAASKPPDGDDVNMRSQP